MRVSEFFVGVTEQVRIAQQDGQVDSRAADLGVALLDEMEAVIDEARGDFEIEDPASFVVIVQAHAALMAALDRILGGAALDIEELGVG